MKESKRYICLTLIVFILFLTVSGSVVAEEDCNHSRGYYTISAVSATCSAAGNIAYKECKLFCGYITDMKGNPITLEDTVVPATGEHTFNDEGRCTYCGSTCEHKGGAATCTEKAVCSVCSRPYGELDKTNHSSAETVLKNEKASSCTVEGYSGDVYYKCCDTLKENGVETPMKDHNCGDVFTETDSFNHGRKCEDCGIYIDIASHIWKESDESFDSSCTEDGFKEFYCEICYTRKSETVPSKGHSEATRIENVVPVSCSADGSYDIVTYCTDCNENVSRETVIVPLTGEHVYSFEVVDSRVEPTCTSEGSVAMMCVCSAVSIVTLETDADAHDWGDWIVVKDAACNEKGLKKRTCLYDPTHMQTEEISALDHTLTQTEAVLATCTSDGNIAYWSCSLCLKKYLDHECINEVFDVIVNMKEHTFSEYKYNDDATCTNDGTETAVCSNCKTTVDSRIKEGSKLEHSFTRYVSNNDATCTQDGTVTAVCDICKTKSDTKTEVGSKEFASHKPDETGKTCLLCGKALSEGHTWSEDKAVIKETSCNEDGAEAVVCIECGEIKEGTKTAIPATGHQFTEDWKEILSPSCEQKGVRIKVCKNCYDVISETISKTEHSDDNGDGKCDYCEYVIYAVKDDSENIIITQTPDESENTDASLDCTCSCHKSGISKVIFNILNFFYKIFGINRVCQCGVAH